LPLAAIAAVLLAAADATAQQPLPEPVTAAPTADASADRSPFPPRRIPRLGPPGAVDKDPSRPAVEDFGDGRLRIGAILIDQPSQRFSVNGEITPRGAADGQLTALVVARDAVRVGDGAVVVETDAVTFRVACILIGLEATVAGDPSGPAASPGGDGEAVSIAVSWQVKGRTVTKLASSLLHAPNGGFAADEWVYRGGNPMPANGETAAGAGTLIALAADAHGLIHHRDAVALGGEGAIVYAGTAAPAAGTPVTVTVARKAR
jgi:hypothetical protein